MAVTASQLFSQYVNELAKKLEGLDVKSSDFTKAIRETVTRHSSVQKIEYYTRSMGTLVSQLLRCRSEAEVEILVHSLRV